MKLMLILDIFIDFDLPLTNNFAEECEQQKIAHAFAKIPCFIP